MTTIVVVGRQRVKSHFKTKVFGISRRVDWYIVRDGNMLLPKRPITWHGVKYRRIGFSSASVHGTGLSLRYLLMHSGSCLLLVNVNFHVFCKFPEQFTLAFGIHCLRAKPLDPRGSARTWRTPDCSCGKELHKLPRYFRNTNFQLV